MSYKRMLKTMLLFCAIVFTFNALLSISLNNQVNGYIKEGLLDTTTYRASKEPELEGVEEGKNYFYIKDYLVQSYESYAQALAVGPEEQLLYADNGIAYKRLSPWGNQYYVLDFSWLPQGKYNKDEIVKYVGSNNILMSVRSMYLADTLISSSLFYILIYTIVMYIMPSLLISLSKIYAFFKSRKDPEFTEIRQSLLLKLTVNELKSNKDLSIILAIFCYLSGYTGVLNKLIFGGAIGPVVAIVLGVMVLTGIYYLSNTYLKIDDKRLDNELNKKDKN